MANCLLGTNIEKRNSQSRGLQGVYRSRNIERKKKVLAQPWTDRISILSSRCCEKISNNHKSSSSSLTPSRLLLPQEFLEVIQKHVHSRNLSPIICAPRCVFLGFCLLQPPSTLNSFGPPRRLRDRPLIEIYFKRSP